MADCIAFGHRGTLVLNQKASLYFQNISFIFEWMAVIIKLLLTLPLYITLKYARGSRFVVFCCDLEPVDLTHNFQGYFTGAGAVGRLPGCTVANNRRMWIHVWRDSTNIWYPPPPPPPNKSQQNTLYERHAVWSRRRLDSLLIREIFSSQHQRKHQSSASLAFCERNPPVTDGFPSQRASNSTSMFMSWRHQCVRILWPILWIKNQATWGSF